MFKQDFVKAYMLKEIEMMQSDQRIPSRHALCRKLGFSRTTIDIAISELIEEGVLYSKPGSGTFISREYRKKSNTTNDITSWGVILPDISVDIYPLLLRGIEDYCKKKNINVVVCNTDHNITSQNLYAMRMLESGVAGIILIPAMTTNHDISGLLALRDANIPIVFCHRAIDILHTIPFVSSNDFYGGYIATKHLIKMGYKRIAYASFVRYKVSMDRYLGYSAALIENGLEVDQKIILLDTEHHYNMETGSRVLDKEASDRIYEIAKQLIKSDDSVDAFFCYNDRAALGICRAIRAVGKRVSSDIGVIGYDNTSLCTALETELTSVDFKSYTMGVKCADILDKEIQGRPIQGNKVFVFQPELVIRKSCLGKE